VKLVVKMKTYMTV